MSTNNLEYYNQIAANANNGDAASRLKAAAMVMERCGDKEIAETMNLLSAQLDFDDSMEASDAIRRTREKLDAMIAERNKRHAQNYVKLLTDDEIRALSSGEVTEDDYSFLGSCYIKHGLYDPDIFGGSGKIPYYDDKKQKIPADSLGTAMGHIELPCHVMLESTFFHAGHLLRMSVDDIKKVVHYVCYAVVEPGESKLPVGTILNEKDFREHENDEGFIATMGADAVYEMLKNLGLPDHPERMAFQVVPVTAPVTRPIAYSEADQTYFKHPLADAYHRVMFAVSRCRKLKDLGAPDIIMHNEERMLNDAVQMLDKETHNYQKRLYSKNAAKSGLARFTLSQLAVLLRFRNIALDKPECAKLSDIESLNLFPETIILRAEDGTESEISLKEVIDQCVDARMQYSQDHAVIIEEDEEATPEEQKQIDDANSVYELMHEKEDLIIDGAYREREKFVVVFDKELNMYVPAA